MDNIRKLKILPTEGERAFLNFLNSVLNDDFEIFFQPFLNGDRPDIILMKKYYGVMIVEVKDWNLGLYHIDDAGEWRLKKDGKIIKSPLDQVRKYKDNLYDIHSYVLFNERIKNKNAHGLVNTTIYFHGSIEQSINQLLTSQDKYINLLGSDSLTQENFYKILDERYFNRKSQYFTDAVYAEFKRALQPTFHTIEQGKDITYTSKQKEFIESSENVRRKIKGVAGSGKTLVLAKRAVNAHKRTSNRILILTYNIALKNYIHDCISDVRENFNWTNFYIDNYHSFFNKQANNALLKIYNLSAYEDSDFFDNAVDKIDKYDAIFIDEIQDYKIEWIRIIEKHFLAEKGEFVLFGDEKQNLYERKLDDERRTKTTIPGRWAVLDESFRFGENIAELAVRFQETFFTDKYDIDQIQIVRQQNLLTQISGGKIAHYYLGKETVIVELMNGIRAKISKDGIHSNDIAFIASNHEILREVDAEIRNVWREKTMTTFEREEQNDSRKENEMRKNKRLHFWMNPGTYKLATIHSFKGWEIPTLFLFIDANESNYELIYAALTRCRKNLFIINIANQKLKQFFDKNGDIVSSYNIDKKEVDRQSNNNQDNGNDSSLKKVQTVEIKTLGDVEKEENENVCVQITSAVDELKGRNSQFKIVILGETADKKDMIESKMGSFFNKCNISSTQWDVDFINNRKLKNGNKLKSLREGQSSYSLMITGQIHKHSGKGNSDANLITELKKGKYIECVNGCDPQRKLPTNRIIEILEKYFKDKVRELNHSI